MTMLINRSTAKAAGSRRYFTGRPCVNGHVAERITRCGRCIECLRQWKEADRQANSQLRREQRAALYAANKPKVREQSIAWRAANRDKCRAQRKAWRAANADSVRGRRAAYLAANREKLRAQCAEWRAANPEKVRASKAKRRSRVVQAGGNYTAEELRRLFDAQRRKCANCGASIKGGYHADHIMPLALGGSNSIKNIQLLCPSCNVRKSALHPLAWAKRQGKLL